MAEASDETNVVIDPVSAVYIIFVKGDVLNREDAVLVLRDTTAEKSVLMPYADEVQAVEASSYLTGESMELSRAPEREDNSDVWADIGAEGTESSEEDSLMKQAALEYAVTSVVNEDILDDVSLQYVAAGSSLKEYILVSGLQESYEYLFVNYAS